MPRIRWAGIVVAARRLVVRHPAARWVVVGLCCLLALRSVTSARDDAAAARDRWETVGPVLVATAEIRPGEPLDDTVTELRRLPIGAVPPSALVNRPDGLVATDPIGVGEIVVAGHASTGSSAGALAVGTAGVPLPRPAGWAPAIGDAVSVISTGDPVGLGAAPGGPVVVSAAASVIGVDADGILLAVPDAEVAAVAAAGASGQAVLVLLPG